MGKCLSILSREVQRVASEPISVSALERIKSQIKGSIILASESVEARQESLGRNEIYFGRHISTEEIVAEIEKVSIDRVQNMAKQLFKEIENVSDAIKLSVGGTAEKIAEHMKLAPGTWQVSFQSRLGRELQLKTQGEQSNSCMITMLT